MEQETAPDRKYTRALLAAAGAHSDFIEVYMTSFDGRHSAAQELDKELFDLEQYSDNPSLGGGFFAALWKDGATEAWPRADGTNRKILEKAGLGREIIV